MVFDKDLNKFLFYTNFLAKLFQFIYDIFRIHETAKINKCIYFLRFAENFSF